MHENPVAIRRARQETPRYELDDEPGLGPFTLTDFLSVNAEGLSPEDIEAIRNLEPDEAYTGGGGAAAEWTIRRLRGRRDNPTPALLHTLRVRAHRSVQLVRGENGTIKIHFYATPAWEALPMDERNNVLDEFMEHLGVDALRLHADGVVTWDDEKTFGKYVTMVVDNEEPDWSYDDGEVSTISTRYTPGRLEGPLSPFRKRRREEDRAMAEAKAKSGRRRKNPVATKGAHQRFETPTHVFTNEEDGTSARVWPATHGGYNVVFRDDESGEHIHVRSGVKSEAEAVRLAKESIFGPTRRRENPEGAKGHHRRNPIQHPPSDFGKLKLWKLNERTGYWDYQRTVDPDTADEWRRRFVLDEPTATFKVSRMKPAPPALRAASVGTRGFERSRRGNPTVTSNEPLSYGPDVTEIEPMDEQVISDRAEHERVRENHRRYRVGMHLTPEEIHELVERGLIQASDSAAAGGMSSRELAMHMPFVKQGEVEGPGGGRRWYVFIWSPLGKYIPQGEFLTEKEARADLKSWHDAHHEMVARMQSAERGEPSIVVREVRQAAGGGAPPALPPAQIRALPPASVPPAAAEPAEEPSGGRSQGSVNRGWLKKQVEAGHVTMTGSYSFDDMHGASESNEVRKVSIRAEGDRSYPDDEVKLWEGDFDSSSGTAYWTNKAKGKLVLIVHSNLSYDLQVDPKYIPKTAPKKEPPAPEGTSPEFASDKAAQLYAKIAAAPLPSVVNAAERKKWGKEIAKDFRDLFAKMGLRGISATSDGGKVEVNLPHVSLPTTEMYAPEPGNRYAPSEKLKAARALRTEAGKKVEAILLAAFPDLDDRSDTQTDYFNYKFTVN